MTALLPFLAGALGGAAVLALALAIRSYRRRRYRRSVARVREVLDAAGARVVQVAVE